MRTLSGVLTSTAVALALATPAAPVAAQAPTAAAPAGTSVAERARATVSLSRSAPFSHVGQRGVKITAKVREGGRAARGTVVFRVDGTKLRTVSLRRGKAAVRLPSRLRAGRHTVRVQHGRAHDTIRVRVHRSALRTARTAYTISRTQTLGSLPRLSGAVRYKGATATRGYVEVYEGSGTRAYQAPSYFQSTSVYGDGTFQFARFFEEVQAKAPGTYRFRAYYVARDTRADRESLYSPVITVTVTA